MVPTVFPHDRLSKTYLAFPLVPSFIAKRTTYQSLLNTGALTKFITKHLWFSRARLSRRPSALPLSEVYRNGRIVRGVNRLKQRYYEKKLTDELAVALCSAFQLQDKTALQDFLSAVILSECVYKKVETTWENVASIIGQFCLDFPPGFVQIDTVQCTLHEVPHNYIIATNATTVFVAFMGTKQPRDLGADVNFLPEALWDEPAALFTNQTPPAAHRGFHTRAKAIDIKHMYELAKSQGKRLVLCGHSLGAAVAKLCTVRLLKQLPNWPRPDVHCYGFAAPAVGNASLARLIEQQGWAEHISTYLMPEDDVMRLVSLAQQNGIPFNLLQRATEPQLEGRSEEQVLPPEQTMLASEVSVSDILPWTAVTSGVTLSEKEAASELALMLQDEGDCPVNAPESVSSELPVPAQLEQVITPRSSVAAEPSAASQDSHNSKSSVVVADQDILAATLAEEEQRASILGSLALQGKLGLKQLKKIARRAQGTWATAASRVMSRYMPFGKHFFLMPNLQIVSMEELHSRPQSLQFLPPAQDTRPAGPFTFHRMMSYRGRIIQVLQKVGGARLERYMAQPRTPPRITVGDCCFPQTKITSAAAWLPLLAAPTQAHSSSRTSAAATSLASVDDDSPAAVPGHQPSSLTAEQTDALRTSATARGPHGLGAAVPLPGRRRTKSVAMMVKVDGCGLWQCRSFAVRVDGQAASFAAEVTHVGEDSLQPQRSADVDAVADIAAAEASSPVPSRRPAWMMALQPLGQVAGAAGKLVQVVLGGVMGVNRRLWGNQQLHPLQHETQQAHAVLRVQLPTAVVRKLHESVSTPGTAASPLTLIARSDFHEVSVAVELRPNKVALLGTSEFAALLLHGSMSGQLGLAVGPAHGRSFLPSWVPRLSLMAVLNLLGRKQANKATTPMPASTGPHPSPTRERQPGEAVARQPALHLQAAAAQPVSSQQGSSRPPVSLPFPVFNPAAAMAAAVTAVSLAAVAAAGAEMGSIPEQLATSNSIVPTSGRLSALASQLGNRRRTTSSKTAITATTAAMALPRTRKDAKESDRNKSSGQVAVVASGGKSPRERYTEAGGEAAVREAIYSLHVTPGPDNRGMGFTSASEPYAAPAPAVSAERQRWSWLSQARALKRAQQLGLEAPAAVLPATSNGTVSSTRMAVLPSKMHAGVLYELTATSADPNPAASLLQLCKVLQRQVAQMSWFTAVWMALRGNGAVASWQTTSQMTGMFGSMMMALPSGPLQFFNLVAENASIEHLHALMVVHLVGADDTLLRSPEFVKLLGLARSADVAIIPVVLASKDSHPGEVLLAQYSICQACGVPLGVERLVRVEPGLVLAGDVAAVQTLSAAQRKQLGESVQELWHHTNQELLAKQLQLVNIIPRHSMLPVAWL